MSVRHSEPRLKLNPTSDCGAAKVEKIPSPMC